MATKTIAEVSKETLTIEAYLRDLPEGHILYFGELEKECNVEMNEKGKSYLRTALKRLDLEYSCIWGEGIRLADVSIASDIIVTKLSKISNAVKRGQKTYNHISEKFYDRLTQDEQRQIIFIGSGFAAIQLAVENGRRVLKQRQETKGMPQLPKN